MATGGAKEARRPKIGAQPLSVRTGGDEEVCHEAKLDGNPTDPFHQHVVKLCCEEVLNGKAADSVFRV